jgi:hypothetical protein
MILNVMMKFGASLTVINYAPRVVSNAPRVISNAPRVVSNAPRVVSYAPNIFILQAIDVSSTDFYKGWQICKTTQHFMAGPKFSAKNI